MSNQLFLASLIAVTACATGGAQGDTAPQAPGAPPTPGIKRDTPAVCSPGGDVVFEIDHKSDIATNATQAFQVFANGMYTVTRVQNGKTTSATGCLGTPDVAKIEGALKGQAWQLTAQQFRCMAYSADYVEYRFHGKVVRTVRMCDGMVLDAKSQKALTDVLAIVNPLDVAPATPPPAPPTP